MALSLSNSIVIQEAVTSSGVVIREVIDCIEDKNVRAMIIFEGTDRSEWITVWGPEDYDIDWTQEQLESAVVALLDARAES
jgi:hypothetical protein